MQPAPAYRQAMSRPPVPVASLTDIEFETDGTPVRPDTMFESDWCQVHHIAPGKQPHKVRMERDVHTLLIFDGGSFSEGERRVDGSRLGTTGALDTGIDVLPAGSRLVGWSGLECNIGCTLISVATPRVGALVGHADDDVAILPGINLRNELLQPLAARIRRWSAAEGEATDALQRETMLMLLVQEVCRVQRSASPSRTGHRGGLSARTQRVVREYVSHNLDDRIDLQTLADLAGMSRFHFSRAFKTSFGLPPHKYLTAERVRTAAALMRQTQTSITDIALRVGFSCSSELTRAFKQAMGCTPRDFRSSAGA